MTSTAPHESRIQVRGYDVLTRAVCWLGPILAPLAIAALGGVFVLVAQLSHCLVSEGDHRGYLMNLSWSLSMFLLFPPAFALVALFYRRIPRLTEAIGDNLRLSETDRKALAKGVDHELNRSGPLWYYAIALPMWVAYFYGSRNSPTWLWEDFKPPGDSFWSWGTFGQITVLGYLSSVVQLVLGSSVMCLIRAIYVGQAMCKEAEKHADDADPLHADGCYGFGGLRSQLHITFGILWFLGLYIVLYHIDKIFIQRDHESSLLISTIYVLGFLAVASLLYRRVLAPSHAVMVSIKKRTLRPLSVFLEKQRKLWANASPKSDEALKYAEVHEKYLQLKPQLREWLVLPVSGPVLAMGTTLNLVPPLAAIAFEIYVHFAPKG